MHSNSTAPSVEHRAPHCPVLGAQDLRDTRVLDDVHAAYARFREAGPAIWNDSLGLWVVTRYQDVKAALKDPRFSVDKINAFAARHRAAEVPPAEGSRAAAHLHSVELLSGALSDWMVFADPPRHAALRRAMQNAFLARDTPLLEPLVRSVVDELMQALDSGPCFELELVQSFAYPLPAMVISRLFGLSADASQLIKGWSESLGRFVLGGAAVADRHQHAAQAVGEMAACFAELIKASRDGTNEAPFTRRLIRDGAHLGDEELVHTLMLVLFAGHETTTNLIASGALVCARSPELWARLRAQPSLLPEVVEEFLRLEGPVQMVLRIAREDLCIGSQRIAAGQRVALVLNAANRDPAVFDAPDSLDPSRRRGRHLAFGPGTHMCLGAPLARLVARIAFEALLERYAALELLTDSLNWRAETIIHGLQRLPLRLRRA
ncbi:MAG: cytochrome P450 [Gammaproteobacteria bacterium]|nr:cytochrome P450 [Gammaproteobacteria bacterium]